MALKRGFDSSENKRVAEESLITTEQLALIGFAARLGTSIANDADISKDGDVREEAQLLMSLLSSKPSSQSLVCEEEMPDESSSQESATQGSHRDAFSFTCPSLSLKPTSFSPPQDSPARKNSSESEESVPSLVTPPAQLFGRPLKVDDRNALRLSAEAMARNVLESVDEALQWRIKTWVDAVALSLLAKEKALIQEVDGEDEDAKRKVLEQLLNSPEAKVITSLQQVANAIEITDVKTSFRVLSKCVADQESSSPQKKQRKQEYRVMHTMSFQAVLNLVTPAGYTEVMLQTPGTIEGTFVKNNAGEETLTGVTVELDTSTLATTIERSSRIVVRSATETCVKPPPSSEEEEDEEAPQEKEVQEEVQQDTVQEQDTDELVCMPTPKKSHIEYTDVAAPAAAVVTPRHPSPPSLYCDSNTTEKLIRFPLDADAFRAVSPQPRTTDVASFLFTPRKSTISVPSLVSPSPETPLQKAVSLSSEGLLPTSSIPSLVPKKRPSFPILVEVARAAMQAS